MNSGVEEKALIEEVLAGVDNAFYKLIKRYERLVFHIVYRMIPNRDIHEDLGQDIFMKVYSKLHTFKGDSKLSTWIARITYNTCLSHLEKKKASLIDDVVATQEEDDEPESLLNRIEDEEILPDSYVEQEITSEIVQKEIMNLPANYRVIVTLYHLEDMKYKEIAEITKLPEGSVKSYLFRARKMLKTRLIKQYSMEDLCL